MKSPLTGKEMPLRTRPERLAYRKEEFEIIYQYFLCEDTGEEFVTPELGDRNLQQVYDTYRAKHRIPFPEEIRAIRQQYDLSATKMAEVLGFGVNMYRQYEAGEMPSDSNAKLIALARDPEQFGKLLQNSDVFGEKELEKHLKHIEKLAERERKSRCYRYEEFFFGETVPSEFNGYREPALARVMQVLVFIASELKPYKTAFNKMLFYADFGHFKQTNRSITGLRYRAIQRGIVPEFYDRLFAEAEQQGLLSVDVKEMVNGSELVEARQYRVAEGVSFQADYFSPDEIQTLREVVRRFRGLRTADLVEKNHEEPAWRDLSESRQLVSYRYSFALIHM